MCLAFKKGLSRSLDLDLTYFIVNYITFGSDKSYSNLQRSSTISLHERSLDISRALKSVNLIQSSLDCRANVEQFNHQCFERSAKICESLDIEIKKPRICGRQIMRDNVEAESPENYFRKSITVPFLYCTLNEMKTRFTDLHARTALGLQLVPSIIENIAP
jgi:hypothetical protein